ncbi:hypothetical protein ACA545_02145 [Vibrio cholerae]|uniref:hypothetical protein n=1 Tax=Vibrio cholerae TaxID=666 RepID=UPI003A0FC643
MAVAQIHHLGFQLAAIAQGQGDVFLLLASDADEEHDIVDINVVRVSLKKILGVAAATVISHSQQRPPHRLSGVVGELMTISAMPRSTTLVSSLLPSPKARVMSSPTLASPLTVPLRVTQD